MFSLAIKGNTLKEARKKLSALLFISLLALAICPGTGYADDESGETGDKANSWRFNNGELVTTDQGAYPDDDGIQVLAPKRTTRDTPYSTGLTALITGTALAMARKGSLMFLSTTETLTGRKLKQPASIMPLSAAGTGKIKGTKTTVNG